MSGGRSARHSVLLVEDEPGDARLIQEAFAAASFKCHLDRVADGIEAMEHLRAILGGTVGHRLPDLVLLDINMPRMNGHEVLAEMKSDPQLREIPVVVLSTSTAPRDITMAYNEGAAGFVTKPLDISALFEVVQGIENYWFGVAELPR